MKIREAFLNDKSIVSKFTRVILVFLLIAILMAFTANHGLAGKFQTLSKKMGKSSCKANLDNFSEEKDADVIP